MQIYFWAKLKMTIKPVKMDQLSRFFFSKLYKIFSPNLLKQVRTQKNVVLIKSSRKLKFEGCKHFHSKKQLLITLDLKYFIIQTKLKYLKSIIQSRSLLLPTYCTWQAEHPYPYDRGNLHFSEWQLKQLRLNKWPEASVSNETRKRYSFVYTFAEVWARKTRIRLALNAHQSYPLQSKTMECKVFGWNVTSFDGM